MKMMSKREPVSKFYVKKLKVCCDRRGVSTLVLLWNKTAASEMGLLTFQHSVHVWVNFLVIIITT
jgi:hypothetical protein